MPQWRLDTNVVLRAASPADREHPTIIAAIERLLLSGNELLLAPQVLMEFWTVATRPVDVNGYGWSAPITEGKIADLRRQFPLLPETEAVFDEWLRLVGTHNVFGKPAHDARLVAWMNTHGVRNLLTINVADFTRYGIVAVSPKDI